MDKYVHFQGLRYTNIKQIYIYMKEKQEKLERFKGHANFICVFMPHPSSIQ